MHNARCFCLLMSAALLCISSGLAQSLSADSFLNDVAAHPVSDEAQQNQSAEVYMALNNAPPAEVERVIPAVLHYARVGTRERGPTNDHQLPGWIGLLDQSSDRLAQPRRRCRRISRALADAGKTDAD